MDEGTLHDFVRRGQAAQRAVDRATLDTSAWLTKEEAAAHAGVTTKTIERRAKAGDLQQDWRRQTHGPRVRVFHRRDVERLRRELNPERPPFVEPVSAPPPAEPPATAIAPREEPAPMLAAFLALVEAIVSQTSHYPRSETSQTRYVDTAAALADVGCGLRHLHRQRRAGVQRAVFTNGEWRWCVADFDKL